MTQQVIAALDQGTTNTKAFLVNVKGQMVREASRINTVSYPQLGWVEQDAQELWRTSAETLSEIFLDIPTDRIVGIGLTNQRETVLIWDRKSGEPVGPCVVWQCHRSHEFCAQLKSRGFEPFIRSRTGLTIDPMFSASKMRWLLDHLPDGQHRAENGELCIGTIDSWLVWKLTGGKHFVCDVTNASRTQLMSLRELSWDTELLGIFGIPVQSLPHILPSGDANGFGSTIASGGIPAGIRIGCAIGDSHAALYGNAGFHPGAVKVTYGTGSSLMAPTPSPMLSSHGMSTTVAWGFRDRTTYAVEGNIYVTGAAVQWTGQLLGLDDPVGPQIENLAASVPDNGGVYFVPALTGLGAPYWSDTARGVICGITSGTTAGHLARATLEAIAYQIRDVYEAMQQDIGPFSVIHADGGPTRNRFLMQLQADILGVPVLRNMTTDLSALGAAYIAGLTVGFWSSENEISNLERVTERYEPHSADSMRDGMYNGWKQAVARTIFNPDTNGTR